LYFGRNLLMLQSNLLPPKRKVSEYLPDYRVLCSKSQCSSFLLFHVNPSPDLSHLFLVFLYSLLALSISKVPLLVRCKFTSYGPVDFYFSSISFNPVFLYLVVMGVIVLLFHNFISYHFAVCLMI
jgi:hypothetical protein